MNKIKRGMSDLEELKRINRDLMKIYHEQNSVHAPVSNNYDTR